VIFLVFLIMKGVEMRLLACVGVAVTCLLSSQAFAQAKNFEGFSIGLNASNSSAASKDSDGKYKGSTILTSIDFGYTQAFSEQATLGVVATIDLDKTKSGSYDVGYDIRGKNHFSINFQPGYAISKDVLVYGNLGVHQITMSITNDNIGKKTFTGYGYGLGAQIAINKSLYVKAEVQQVNYQQKNSSNVDGDDLKPLTTLGIVGVGYRF
jgi:opacity protein-like surface antigen